MSSSEYSRSLKEVSKRRTERKRELASRFAPISEEISAFYDSRRLTEEDIDHMAEIFSEGRVFNRNARLRSTHE